MQLHSGGHRPLLVQTAALGTVSARLPTHRKPTAGKRRWSRACRELQPGASSWGSWLSFRAWPPLLAVPSALSHSSFPGGSTGLSSRQLPLVRSLFSPRPLSLPSELALLPLMGFSQGPLADCGCQGQLSLADVPHETLLCPSVRWHSGGCSTAPGLIKKTHENTLCLLKGSFVALGLLTFLGPQERRGHTRPFLRATLSAATSDWASHVARGG